MSTLCAIDSNEILESSCDFIGRFGKLKSRKHVFGAVMIRSCFGVTAALVHFLLGFFWAICGIVHKGPTLSPTLRLFELQNMQQQVISAGSSNCFFDACFRLPSTSIPVQRSSPHSSFPSLITNFKISTSEPCTSELWALLGLAGKATCLQRSFQVELIKEFAGVWNSG